jgi:hypothetical protein
MLYVVTIPNSNGTTTVREFLHKEKIKSKFIFLDKGKPFPVKCPESSKYKVWIACHVKPTGGIDVFYYCTRKEDAILLALTFAGGVST